MLISQRVRVCESMTVRGAPDATLTVMRLWGERSMMWIGNKTCLAKEPLQMCDTILQTLHITTSD